MAEVTESSCNEAEDEAHLPEIQFFHSDKMAFRSIKHVDDLSARLVAIHTSEQEENRGTHYNSVPV